MKKIVVVLLCFCLLLSTGCGAKKDAATPTPEATATPEAAATPETQSDADNNSNGSDENAFQGSGYSLTPAEGWTEKEVSGITVFYAPDGSSNLNVVTESLPGEYTATEYAKASLPSLESVYPDMSNVNEKSVTVNGYDGYCRSFSGSMSDIKMDFTQYYVVKNKIAYVISYTSVGTDDYTKDVESMVATFKITD